MGYQRLPGRGLYRYLHSTRDDYILTAQYADLYVTNTSKPLTGAAFMDEDGEVITSLTLYRGLHHQGRL
ncbi:MAG: hypothetical protein ACLU9S_13390 [Oscillospiraceae bacterium]